MKTQEFTQLTLDVIIPVYNEEPNIPILIRCLKELQQEIKAVKIEVIFVDDHSMDNSPALLKDACRQNENYHYLRLSCNCGSHIAILAGLEHSQGDCAVFLAADLQDPPGLIPQMLKPWQMGNHIVWAVRESREGISWVGNLFSNAFYRLLNRFGQVKVPPRGSDFALLDRAVIGALLQASSTNPSLGGEIARLGFRQTQIPYTKGKREFGHSKWSLGRKLHAFADAFVLFSYTPLRAMSYFGMVCSLLGFFYTLVVIFLRIFFGTQIEGWASLMVVVLLLGGIQMIMLGVLGEYLWRTLEAARRRPRYFLEDSFGLEKPSVTERNNSQVLKDDLGD